MADSHSTTRVWFVGAGPGELDMLTVRALKLLQQAEVVLFDALVSPGIIKLATSAEKIAVGKRAGKNSMKQSEINRLLVQCALSGKSVVRLKGGDPTLFGRLDEEIGALSEIGIGFEVVPGVTSACAAAAALKTSLTTRGVARQVSFVTPSVENSANGAHFDGLTISKNQTTVFYMAGRISRQLGNALLRNGFSAQDMVAVVRNAGRETQQVDWINVAMLAVQPVLPGVADGGPVLLIAGLSPRLDRVPDLAHHIGSAASSNQSSQFVMQRHLD